LSSVSKSPAPISRSTPSKPDPYRLGWRYVRVTRPDGSKAFDQVPLTRDEVLFPQEDDFIVQNTAHNADRGCLDDVFNGRLNENPTAVVLADCRVDWNIPGVRPLGPDIAVFLGVKRARSQHWDTFSVAIEGAKPALAVELTSRSTRKNDLGIKVDFYHRAGVPLYVIVDAVGHGAKRRVKLIGYRFTRKAF
jgi:colicin import membrane protein